MFVGSETRPSASDFAKRRDGTSVVTFWTRPSPKGEETHMPKMKTNRAARKRFRKTGSGKIRRARSGHKHLMRGKNASRLRRLRKRALVDDRDEKKVKEILPYL
jgi:large subunit ribosomal protein L35